MSRKRHYYPSVEEMYWASPDEGTQVPGPSMWELFKNCHFFDGTLTYIPEGSTEPIYYPAIGSTFGSGETFTPSALAHYFKWRNWDRKFGRPLDSYLRKYRGNFSFAISAYLADFRDNSDYFLKSLEFKYLEIMKTLGLNGDFNTDIKIKKKDMGQIQFDHDPDTIEQGLEYTITSNSVALAATTGTNVDVDTWDSTNQKDQTSHGKKVTHNTTPFDNATPREEFDDTESGTTSNYKTPSAVVKKFNSEKFIDTTQQIQPEIITEIDSSPDLIEKARILSDYNVIDMFMKEVEDRFLLSTYFVESYPTF